MHVVYIHIYISTYLIYTRERKVKIQFVDKDRAAGWTDNRILKFSDWLKNVFPYS